MTDPQRLSGGIDISIPLRFKGPQPNAYGVERAMSEPVRAGDLVGDTRQGGSVNFEKYTFIPHCNGTHTECVGHITNERISVRDCLKDVLIPALLITVEPGFANGDAVIGAEVLDVKFSVFDALGPSALIVRTLPNGLDKLTAQYGESNIPPYFTAEAIRMVTALGFAHLLVDVPSIDRIFDEGKLINHRIFWNVDEGSFETNPDTRINATITELVYVPDEVPDGEYILNLQIAPFDSDCAPSRPILFRGSRPRKF